MRAELVSRHGTWEDVKAAAMVTVGKDAGEGEIPASWKKKMCLCEHSPIRLLNFTIQLYDIPSWVSVHLVRHKIGVEHFVQSQRSDRTGICRDKLPQDTPVNHRLALNAQALINISRKRLCYKAATETRAVWDSVIFCIIPVEPELAECCVPNCVYQGGCVEYAPCKKISNGTLSSMMYAHRRIPLPVEKK
jgi:hypothetical protein